MKTGIFFDGYHCQKFFNATGKQKNNKDLKYNKIDFSKVLRRIVKQAEEKSRKEFNVIDKAWFQGMSENLFGEVNINQCKDIEELRGMVWKYQNDRQLYLHLIRHGIESVFLEHAMDDRGKYREKGIDSALVVNCMNSVNQLDLDCVILCTNDSDFEPLLHNLTKKGIYTITVTFDAVEKVSERLKRQCNIQFEYK